MARIGQASFQWPGLVTSVEFDVFNASPTFYTTSPHSGTYCGRVSSLSSGAAQGFALRFIPATTPISVIYAKAWVYPATFPTAANTFLSFGPNASGLQAPMALLCDNGGTVTFKNYTSSATYNTVGASVTTAQLTQNTWNEIDLFISATGNSVSAWTIKINGTTVHNVTAQSTNSPQLTYMTGGLNLFSEAQTTGDFRFADFVVNDASGSACNTYVPSGTKVGCLKADGDGGTTPRYDTNGGAGTSSNWQKLTDVSPGTGGPLQTTAYLQSKLNDNTLHDTVTLANTGIPSNSTIDCVMAWYRMGGQASISSNQAVKGELITSGGTTQWATAVAPNTTFWRNLPNSVNFAMLPSTSNIHYTDPNGSVTWTPALLDSLKLGIQQTLSTSSNVIKMNGMWVTYTYVEGTTTTDTSPYFFADA